MRNVCQAYPPSFCHHRGMVAMIPRKPLIPVQNRRAKSFVDSVAHQAPRSNASPSIFNYARRGRGVQGESVNSGSNPGFIISRRRGGAGF
jgi:hypothetical protein